MIIRHFIIMKRGNFFQVSEKQTINELKKNIGDLSNYRDIERSPISALGQSASLRILMVLPVKG